VWLVPIGSTTNRVSLTVHAGGGLVVDSPRRSEVKFISESITVIWSLEVLTEMMRPGGEESGGDESDGSLLRRMHSGSDEDAAYNLYVRYAQRLIHLARQKTPADLATRVDPEDIVQSVFRTFFRRASAGQYNVPEGEELWKLLLVIALNKLRSHGTFHRAGKRDVQKTANLGDHQEIAGDQFEAELAKRFLQMSIEDVVCKLPVASQMIIRLRIEGYEMQEIAQRVQRSKRTVERVLQAFRSAMMSELEGESE
jgi:RNA polymerase sigma-70 factor, ECF subfamily